MKISLEQLRGYQELGCFSFPLCAFLLTNRPQELETVVFDQVYQDSIPTRLGELDVRMNDSDSLRSCLTLFLPPESTGRVRCHHRAGKVCAQPKARMPSPMKTSHMYHRRVEQLFCEALCSAEGPPSGAGS